MTCLHQGMLGTWLVNDGSYAGPLVESQLPTFSMAAQKTCLQGASACASAWHFEVLTDRELRTTVRRRRRLASLRECEQLCLQERDFICRQVIHISVFVWSYFRFKDSTFRDYFPPIYQLMLLAISSYGSKTRLCDSFILMDCRTVWFESRASQISV